MKSRLVDEKNVDMTSSVVAHALLFLFPVPGLQWFVVMLIVCISINTLNMRIYFNAFIKETWVIYTIVTIDFDVKSNHSRIQYYLYHDMLI